MINPVKSFLTHGPQSFPSSNLKVCNERSSNILQVKYKGMVQELDHSTAGRIRVPGRMYRLKMMMSTGT